MKAPLIGSCYRTSLVIGVLKSIQLFIKTGFSLKKACENTIISLQNAPLKSALKNTLQAINAGDSLSVSLGNYAQDFFDKNTIGLIALGEQAGTLEEMLGQSIQLLEQNLKTKLNILSTVIQPILLIIVGLLIAAILIFTYLPIFSLATMIN